MPKTSSTPKRTALSDISNIRHNKLRCRDLSAPGKIPGAAANKAAVTLPPTLPRKRGYATISNADACKLSIPIKAAKRFEIENLSTCSTCASSASQEEEVNVRQTAELREAVDASLELNLELQDSDGPWLDYMARQPELNAQMRKALVDWLIEVCQHFRLRAETTFLTVDLVDRVLDKQQVSRKRLQLVGITALWIATKFEETKPPKVQLLINMTDKVYTEQEVLHMEISMLTALDFKIFRSNAVHYMRHFQQSVYGGNVNVALAQQLMELGLAEYRTLQYAPSHLAASALLVACKLELRQPAFGSIAVRAKYELMLKPCAKLLRDLLGTVDKETWRKRSTAM